MSRLNVSQVFVALGLLLAAAIARGDENDAPADKTNGKLRQVDFFEQHIRPLLIEHCYECHSAKAEKLQGALALDSKPGWMAGGDGGAVIVPGKPDESPLMDAVRYESYEMPPLGKLPEDQIALLEKWIAMGAPDPRTTDPRTSNAATQKQSTIDWEQAREFWAFQPPRRNELPRVTNDAWSRGAIDRFVLAKLEAAELQPSIDAPRATLLRRVSYDLIGLPPSPEEIDAFSKDPSSHALDRVIDRLLASPHFGERWGRHWLDIARFAESTGGGRSLLYGEAWRYRDYVIRSFNQDKPFDRFIVEQIAGDLLPFDDFRIGRDQLIATGFLALGPSNYELQDKQQLRADIIDEQIDTVGRAFLGMTLGCARCHDHKFDPIPTRDYYALAGIFHGTRSVIDANVSSWVKRSLPISPRDQRRIDEHHAALTRLEERIADVEKRRDELVAMIPILTLDDSDATLSGNWKTSTSVKPYVGESYRYASGDGSRAVYEFVVPSAGRYDVRVAYTPHKNRSSKTEYLVSHIEGITTTHLDQTTPPSTGNTYSSLRQFSFSPDQPATVSVSTQGGRGNVVVDAVQLIRVDQQDEMLEKLTAVEREAIALEQQRAKLEELAPAAPPQAVAVAEHEECGDYHICIRGNIRNLGPTVPRGFLTVAMTRAVPRIEDGTSGRLELAKWIANEENPLTARVVANRIWQHLFGEGLVRTVDNFGAMGQRPSHPQLLDYLALRLVDQGWSMKSLIREIMQSRTYQLSSVATTEARQSDPENRLLSRHSRRRLDAEAIRDSMLALSGELDLTPGGNTVRPGTKQEYGYAFDETRRTIYVPVFRNQLHDLCTVFDFPDPNLSIGRRNVSTLSTQSLFLLNSPFVLDRSRMAARRLLAEHELNDEQRLARLYHLALGRPPYPQEQQLAATFLGKFGMLPSESKVADAAFDQQRLAHWAALAQAVMSCIDFRYVN